MWRTSRLNRVKMRNLVCRTCVYAGERVRVCIVYVRVGKSVWVCAHGCVHREELDVKDITAEPCEDAEPRLFIKVGVCRGVCV